MTSLKRAPNHWRMYRAGAFNFWKYDEQDYYFEDGKLLLRGSNGAGKSVTMNAFVPFLLDGDRRPERFDPFGGKGRTITNFLINENVIDNTTTERTGYLFLEYKKTLADQYLTTGIGMQARLGKNTNLWFFVIPDGCRVGTTLFSLYREKVDDHGALAKVPLTKAEMREQVEMGGGYFTEDPKQYKEWVNRFVFGFSSVDGLDDLVKLLMQIRSAKLSKETKPANLYESLTMSLPEMTVEDIQVLSDAMESMDQLQQQIDKLREEINVLAPLAESYNTYNHYTLTEKAKRFVDAVDVFEERSRQTERLKQAVDRFLGDQNLLVDKERQLREEQRSLNEEQISLNQHEAVDLQNTLSAVRHEQREKIDSRSSNETMLSQKQNDLTMYVSKVTASLNELRSLQSLLEQNEADMKHRAQEVGFSFHDGLLAGSQEHGFSMWKMQIDQYQRQLDDLLSKINKHEETKREHADKNRQLTELRTEREQHEKDLRKQTSRLDEAIEEMRSKFNSWRNQNVEFIYYDETADVIVSLIETLPIEKNVHLLNKEVMTVYEILKDKLDSRKASLQGNLKVIERDISDTEKEIRRWETMPDPEPERHEQSRQFREQLQNEDVPYVPFYQAVDFLEHVSDDVKDKIESALTEMGVLDALILSEKDAGRFPTNDRILHPGIKCENNLLMYLKVTPPEDRSVNEADIVSVLQCISVDEKAEMFAVSAYGRYVTGPITGDAADRKAIYIGKASREAFRKKKIDELTDKKTASKERWHSGAAELHEIEDRTQKLKEERSRFPSEKDVMDSIRLVDLAEAELERCEARVGDTVKYVEQAYVRWQSARREMEEASVGVPLPITHAAITAASRTLRDYRLLVESFEANTKVHQKEEKALTERKQAVVSLELDVSNQKTTIADLQNKINGLEKRAEQLELLLKSPDVDAVFKRIATIVARLNELPEVLQEISKKVGSLEVEIKNTKGNLAILETELEQTASKKALAEKWFLTEVALNLTNFKPGTNPYSSAKAWVSANSLISRHNSVTLAGDLMAHFAAVKNKMVEYQPFAKTIFGSNEERYEIALSYGGRGMTPKDLKAAIEDEIALQEMALTEENRQLFEEVMLNEIGQKVRRRINDAKAWVDTIAKLMASREESSGMKFMLEWKPKSAEEGELATRELVDLFQMDPKLLKESDIRKIAEHFRKKIVRAKSMLETGQSLQKAIADIFDYRQWYQFQMYYQRPGEKRLELTNRRFSSELSGGQRAMSMYIPLLCAAYARYSDARPDALRFVTMDEAFAGVDDDNIADMFELIGGLELDYMFNSQYLWGDYPTIPRLSIYVLISPKNAPDVTLLRFLWDGKARVPVATDAFA